MIGTTELLLIALLALLLFGGKKIPDLMKGLGKGIKEYKKALNGEYDNETSNDGENKVNSTQSSKEDFQTGDNASK
jgi:sec-independent protein translocase protein TatA